MAKQAGPVKMVGTIDDLNYYYRNGVPVVRKAGGGFNGKRIKKEARYARVRENASEFGHCSSVKKWFRLALADFLTRFKDTTQHARMMTLFTGIKDLDTVNERGQRRIFKGLEDPRGVNLLKEFDFSPLNSIARVLGTRGGWDPESNTYTNKFTSRKLKNLPEGTTHLSLQLGFWKLDFKELNFQNAISPEEVCSVSNTPDTLSIRVNTPQIEGISLVLLLVKALQEKNGQLYELNSENSTILETVFCAREVVDE